MDIIDRLKVAINKPFFLEIIILVCWAIWCSHNDLILKGLNPSVFKCRKIFKSEMALVLHKHIMKSYVGLKDWVHAFC
jgi:hypothetical protein